MKSYIKQAALLVLAIGAFSMQSVQAWPWSKAVEQEPIAYKGGPLSREDQTDLCVNHVGTYGAKFKAPSLTSFGSKVKPGFAQLCCNNKTFRDKHTNAASGLSCSNVPISLNKVAIDQTHVKNLCMNQFAAYGKSWKSENAELKAVVNALCCPIKAFTNVNGPAYNAAQALECPEEELSEGTAAEQAEVEQEEETVEAALEEEAEEPVAHRAMAKVPVKAPVVAKAPTAGKTPVTKKASVADVSARFTDAQVVLPANCTIKAPHNTVANCRNQINQRALRGTAK